MQLIQKPTGETVVRISFDQFMRIEYDYQLIELVGEAMALGGVHNLGDSVMIEIEPVAVQS